MVHSDTPGRSPLTGFSSWVEALSATMSLSSAQWNDLRSDGTLAHYLNGAAAEAVRAHIDLMVRRARGVFFTDRQTALRALGEVAESANRTYFDPACGAGDLLLAVANSLPLDVTLGGTLRDWSKRLAGVDPHPEFVAATKLRLNLLARVRHDVGPSTEAGRHDLFQHIRVGDGLAQQPEYETATDIFMNPPFGKVSPPEDYEWASGSTSAAAVFLGHVLSVVRPGTRVIAILPDVLRSGANYEQLRRGVESRATLDSVDLLGRFDPWTDIDTFALRLVVGGEGRRTNWWSRPSVPGRVGDKFSVSVGAVVPHRDTETGEPGPYLHAGALRGLETFDVAAAPKRRFRGRRFKPPFVVVRRTSAPGDRRARATVVLGDEPASVENHLLVAVPVSGFESDCHALAVAFRSETVDLFLDERIRCRHLTVGALRDIPWEAGE